MRQLLGQLDRLLRGEFTAPELLRQGRVEVPVRRLLHASLLCGVVYGVCMGLYSASGDVERGALQFVSSAVKVPLLFLFTLLVTFPSLYVFAALAGSRLGLPEMLRLLVGAVTVNLAVVASFGPVTVFFTVFIKSYAFIALLNVVFFVLAGAVSLGFLSRAVRSVFDGGTPGGGAEKGAAGGAPGGSAPNAGASRSPATAPESRASPWNPVSEVPAPAQATARETPRAADQGRARLIFRVWIVIYGVVGAQMGWILRPFVGNPEMPFLWFRHHRESNFFAALGDLLRDLGGNW